MNVFFGGDFNLIFDRKYDASGGISATKKTNSKTK